MIFPLTWIMERPERMFPVFFLSCFTLSAQDLWYDVSQFALGQNFVVSPDISNVCSNQASLGWIRNHSVSFQHARPFSLKELGLSTMSARYATPNGACGFDLTVMGIKGFQRTSAWVSYGMLLRPGITAGIGIHYWSYQIQEYFFFHPGISFAMGIQARLNDQLLAGAHIFHPLGRYGNQVGKAFDQMIISAGCAYTLFQSFTYLVDVRLSPELKIQTCHGFKVKVNDQFEATMGLHSRPFSLTGGIGIYHHPWSIRLAFELMVNRGFSPASSLNYEW